MPASAPRQDVTLKVDLEPASDCEEQFDLAVYRERAVEIIAWDDNAGSCSGRGVTIRFLTQKIDEAGVIRLAKEHAVAVKAQSEAPATPTTPAPSP